MKAFATVVGWIAASAIVGLILWAAYFLACVLVYWAGIVGAWPC